MEISLREKIVLRFGGKVFREMRTRPGWSGSLPFYLLRCSTHGFYEDYPHGFDEYFVCPECHKAQMRRLGL